VELFVGLVLLVVFVVAVSNVTGRLLGVRLGRWRGALVGAIGWIAGLIAAAYTVGEETEDGGRVLEANGFEEWVAGVTVVIFFGVLAAMPVAIALDLLTRSGGVRPRRRRSRLLHPMRATKVALAPYGRLREVIGNARRENLLHLRYASRSAFESADLSRRVRSVLERSGGILVKFGQIASTRSDVLPAALTEELAKLRSEVRPVGAEHVRAVLEEELGEPVEQAFASFEVEPLAAASIGQTHRAVLLDGTRVVVKVQRPGIGDVVARDAAVLRLASRQLERRVEAARAVGLGGLARELIAGVQEELDYVREATAGTRLREKRAADVGIAVPQVYATLSTDRVLVMEEVIGFSIADQAALDASPVPRPELARRLLASFLGQVLEEGVFHADPHPGNLLIDAEGTIWLLDFGSVGRLDARAHGGLRGIALGVATNDASVLARAARDMAGDPGVADLRALEGDLATQLAQLDEGGIDPRMIGDVLEVMRHHGMRPPGSMTLLARALLTLEGTLRIIDPPFSIQRASKELISEEHRDAFGTPEEIIQREALRSLPALRTLPEHAETIANQLRAGRLTVRTERYAGGDRAVVESWVDRVVLATIGGSGAVASALLLLAAATTDDDDLEVTLAILGFAGLTCATVLLMRGAAQALRRRSARID
jgi:ubiquinone biosynthesis protein